MFRHTGIISLYRQSCVPIFQSNDIILTPGCLSKTILFQTLNTSHLAVESSDSSATFSLSDDGSAHEGRSVEETMERGESRQVLANVSSHDAQLEISRENINTINNNDSVNADSNESSSSSSSSSSFSSSSSSSSSSSTDDEESSTSQDDSEITGKKDANEGYDVGNKDQALSDHLAMIMDVDEDEQGMVWVPLAGQPLPQGMTKKNPSDNTEHLHHYKVRYRQYSNSCSICLSPFHVNDRISWSHTADCPHVFHADCIKDWLTTAGRKYMQRYHRRSNQNIGSVILRQDPISIIFQSPMLCPCCRRPFLMDPSLPGSESNDKEKTNETQVTASVGAITAASSDSNSNVAHESAPGNMGGSVLSGSEDTVNEQSAAQPDLHSSGNQWEAIPV